MNAEPRARPPAGRWRTAGVLAALVWLATAAAGQVPEEIKNAPGLTAFPDADGVVLRQEVEITLARDGKVTRRVLTRTKILREFMMRSGRCDPRVPFDALRQTLEVVRCRTWRRDGTPVDTDPKVGYVEVTPAALERAVDYTNFREMVLVHTGIEHGATMELEYRIADRAPSGRPFWGEVPLAADLPVLVQRVVIRVPEGTHLVIGGLHCELKPAKQTADGADVYTVDRTNVAAVNLEECAGHEREVQPRLVYSSVPAWADAGAHLLKAVAGAADTSKAIQARVARLSEGAGTTLARIYRIHEFVVAGVATVRWPLADFGFTARRASRVYDSACGHALDKAVLLRTMLKEAGVQASVVLASPSAAFSMRVPSPTQLTDVWVAADVGPKRVWLEPTAPLARRSGRDLEGRAILQLDGHGMTVKRVPVSDPAASLAVMTGRVEIGSDGSIGARLRVDLAGSRNPYHRLRDGEGPVRAFLSRVAAGFGGARLATKDVRHFDETLSSFSLRAEGGRLGTGETLEVRLPELPGALAGRDYQLHRRRRSTPLFVPGPATERLEVTIQLPPGYRLTWVPRAVKLENDAGTLNLSVTEKDGAVTYKKIFSLKTRVVPPAAYPAFRQLIGAQRARRSSVLLLRKAER